MNELGIDPFFIPKHWPIWLWSGFVDPRLFILSDDEFWNRYHFEMSKYGFDDNRPYWKGKQNIPECSGCKVKIADSSLLRRKFGINYCPDCFQNQIKREWGNMDKRKQLTPKLAYFLRVATILDQVPTKKLEIFIRRCREEVIKCI